ncbi:MAG TPA: hypothetical protein VL485_21610 [Ktedonobacteraceae bacterium]|nr:hypothetical protein [Ktedonobacteraceae bacterium]
MPGTHVPASLPAQGTLLGGAALCAIASNTLPPSRAAIRVDHLLFSGNVLESMGLSPPMSTKDGITGQTWTLADYDGDKPRRYKGMIGSKCSFHLDHLAERISNMLRNKGKLVHPGWHARRLIVARHQADRGRGMA